MSERIYNIDDINKKIIQKLPVVHPPEEYRSLNYKYVDEDYEIYKKKSQMFLDAVKSFKSVNKDVFANNKVKLETSREPIPVYDRDCTCNYYPKHMRCCEEKSWESGVSVRQRTKREIHQESQVDYEVCSLNPWFKKYSIISKFINAARGIILKHRLLKNLEMLKKLNKRNIRAFEAGHIEFVNVSYFHVFNKYIQ